MKVMLLPVTMVLDFLTNAFLCVNYLRRFVKEHIPVSFGFWKSKVVLKHQSTVIKIIKILKKNFKLKL